MKLAPVKALMRIDHSITPGLFFIPASEAQRDELLALGAVEELNEADAALAEKLSIPFYVDLTK